MHLFEATLNEMRPPLAALLTEGGPVMEPELDDVRDLMREFPAWDFAQKWIAVNSGPDARTLWAWPLEGGRALTALDADEMRRKIREAGG